MEDQQILACPDLYFRKLTGDEVNDVKIFFEELFEFKSLNEWYSVLGQLLVSSTEEISIVRDEEIGSMILEINEYLEKLMESIYVIHETKANSYITQYHSELFN